MKMELSPKQIVNEQGILLKADKTSMANSLELRVPFLDKYVMELASTLPLECRVNTVSTKLALRLAAEKTLPTITAQKDKLGFPVPIREWLKQDEYYNIVKEDIYKLICSICNCVKYFDSLEGITYDIYKSCGDDHRLESGNMMPVARFFDQDYIKCKYF